VKMLGRSKGRKRRSGKVKNGIEEAVDINAQAPPHQKSHMTAPWRCPGVRNRAAQSALLAKDLCSFLDTKTTPSGSAYACPWAFWQRT
jgi:hypothetical protein